MAIDHPPTNKTEEEIQLGAELLAMEERDRQAREDLKRATETVERLSVNKISETENPETPRGEVEDSIAEFNLDSLLPPEFNELDEGQKLKVVRDLKRRIVDIVKSNAQTRYSEHTKTSNFLKKLGSSIAREPLRGNWEHKIFQEVKNSPEGRELIRQDLETLTKKAQQKDVYVSKDGSACISYLDEKTRNEIGEETFETFTIKANVFAFMPYEWGQEKSGKHKKQYEKAKIEYEQVRNEVLKIKTGKEKPEEKGKAMLEILETDNAIKMEQLLNTHPEFEKALDNMTKDPSEIKAFAKFLSGLTNTLTGKNWTNRALMAGGYGARMAAKGAAFLTGVGSLTYLGGTAIGGVVGAIRGRIRGKETLQERQKDARHGQKDVSKEKVVMVDATHLSKRLDDLLQEIKSATTEEERAKKLSMLATRIEHTQGKIEKGQVNFGDAKSSLVNQFNLVNNLNEALVLKETNSENTNKEIKERIDRLLTAQGKNIAEKTSEAQGKFIKKQMWKGAALGAGLATAGYTLRYVGEHFGWWESLGKHMPWHHNEATGTNGTAQDAHPTSPTQTEAPKVASAAPAGVASAPHTTPENSVQPTTPQTAPVSSTTQQPALENEIISKGQGIEHPLIKQIDANPKLAQELGFKGDVNDKVALHKFAQGEAHRIAVNYGYVSKDGLQEVRVTEADKVAFELKAENGHAVITEKTMDGKIKILRGGEEKGHYTFGKNIEDNQYEKEISVTQNKIIPPAEQPAPTPEAAQAPAHETTPAPASEPTPSEAPVEKPEDINATIEKLEKQAQVDVDARDAEILKTEIENQINAGSTVETGSEVPTGSIIDTGREVRVGSGNVYLNDPFKDISHEDNNILLEHPVFAENPYGLSGEKLMRVYEANHKNIDYLSENKLPMSGYINMLKNFTHLEPKSGFLGIGAESSEHFNARALQALAAGKGEASLEKFEKLIREKE